MPKKIKKETIYLLMLFILTITGFVLTGTYAKFTNGYSTVDNAVGLNLAFNLKINNIEEYEEILLKPNTYEIFNVKITNDSEDTTYYGIWYKMIEPKEITDNIIVAKSIESQVPTTGSIEAKKDTTATIIIKNNTNTETKINLGIAHSEKSTNDISYLGGKKLISETTPEVDYTYDNEKKLFISLKDNNITFSPNAINKYTYTKSEQSFSPDHDGVYQLEAWGAQGANATKDGNGKGAYTSGLISLKTQDQLYIYVGENSNQKDTSIFNGSVEKGNGGGATDYRLIPGSWNEKKSLASRIMVAAGGANVSTNSKENAQGRTTSEENIASFGIAEANGGGGFYGGKAGYGGTSYISGQLGNLAIESETNTTFKKNCSKEEIKCSYHYSNKIFKNTTILSGTEEMPNYNHDGKMLGNTGNGYAKITTIAPSISLNSTSINEGEKLEKDQLTCQDNGSGCEIIKIPDTTNLNTGTHSLPITIKDNYGYTYRYSFNINVYHKQKQKLKIEYTPSNVTVYDDMDHIIQSKPLTTSIKNTIRTNNYIGKSSQDNQFFKGKIYQLKIQLSDGTTVLNYNFKKNTTNDLSGNNYHGMLKNGAQIKNDGTEDALYLDGIDDYLQIPSLPNTINLENGFTISLEVSFDSTNHSTQLLNLESENQQDKIAIGSEANSQTITIQMTNNLDTVCNLKLTNQIQLASLTKQPLAKATIGSYVKYVGNNGCTNESCEGQNANHTTLNNGYCEKETEEFNSSGWRIAYIENNTVYLISAGAPECFCSNKNGDVSNSKCQDSITKENINLYTEKLNNFALKYCNSAYAYNGKCDKNSTWNMNQKDFEKITNMSLSKEECYEKDKDKSCGYQNSLIDNGGEYWINSIYDQNSAMLFNYQSEKQQITANKSNLVAGIRPIVRLKSSIIIESGTGTYNDPYTISVG